MDADKLYIGIDPGPTNTGVALAYKNQTSTQVLRLKGNTLTETWDRIQEAFEIVQVTETTPVSVSMERFVPYKGMDTSHSELINQFIGFVSAHYPVNTFRSIDWKPLLCKYAHLKLGFDNPSDKFDKKYSLAMAKFLFPEATVPTDHEGDALCIAYCGYLVDYNIRLKNIRLE